ncbi:MAG: hypothetical protein RLZZ498_1819, partial [Pseudomonadota bacterium]
MSRDDATHSVNIAALEAWLHAHLPGFQGPLTLTKFEGGQSNPTY